uniref:Uncharacterized protein n=1 Tax=Neogobius melanostomus TaxID=47308 RepID=A0A8C6V3C3_9GOBI
MASIGSAERRAAACNVFALAVSELVLGQGFELCLDRSSQSGAGRHL